MAKLRDVQSRTGTIDSGAINLTVKDIPIGDIFIKENIRKQYNGLEELEASIREHGLLQMITVFPVESGYAVKFGHRRFLAYQNLHKKDPEKYNSIRCIISNADKIVVNQLVENVQRKDLSQLDLVVALAALDKDGMEMKQIADIMGQTEGYIRNQFTGINEILSDNDLEHLMEIHAGVKIHDIVETRGIPKQERLELLEQRGKGEISRSEMREKVRILKGGNPVAKPTVAVQDRPVTSSVVNTVAIAESPAAASDTPAIPATPDAADLAHSQGAPDSVSALPYTTQGILEPFEIQVSTKRHRGELVITVFPVLIKDEQILSSIEDDLRVFFSTHKEKYRLA